MRITDGEVGLAMGMGVALRKMNGQHNEDVEHLVTTVRDLLAALVKEQAHAAGLQAMVSAFAAQHPDSPLRTPTGRKFPDGTLEFKSHQIFAQAHDEKGAALGVKNPKGMRTVAT